MEIDSNLEPSSNVEERKMRMALAVNKSSGEFLYAQAKDVVNFFTFLTIPFALLSYYIYNGSTSIGCTITCRVLPSFSLRKVK